MNPYITNEVNTLSPVDLIIKVYDETIISTKRFILDIGNSGENISRAMSLIDSLSASLDRDSELEWIDTMSDLFQFCMFELVSRDKDRIEKLIPILENLRNIWIEAKNTLT